MTEGQEFQTIRITRDDRGVATLSLAAGVDLRLRTGNNGIDLVGQAARLEHPPARSAHRDTNRP